MSHAGATATLRDDAPGPSLDRERVLAAAPDAADGLFRVPKVIGG
jgi:aspartyl/glutamyl-tRNA(Asn/Gln) amidotransferase C subunit